MYNYVIVGYKNTLHLLSTHKNKATIRFEFLVMAFIHSRKQSLLQLSIPFLDCCITYTV